MNIRFYMNMKCSDGDVVLRRDAEVVTLPRIGEEVYDGSETYIVESVCHYMDLQIVEVTLQDPEYESSMSENTESAINDGWELD